MTEPLRPMSTGQVLDHTFALYRKNFLLFVGIATVGPAASVIFQLFTVGANVGSPFSASSRMASSAAIARFGLGMFFRRRILEHQNELLAVRRPNEIIYVLNSFRQLLGLASHSVQ